MRRVLSVALCVLSLVVLSAGQSTDRQDSIAERALGEYRSGDYAAAEKDCRKILKENPSNIYAHIYLGQSLFMQGKYAEAIGPFEDARKLEAGGMKLTPDQHRILLDQLVMSYGITGKLKKVHTLLEEAIQRDPEYPLNYYNLACAFAEEGNKAKMLENLSLAFQHKDHIIKGEQMPDPRSDDSFQPYVHDPEFLRLMKQLGYD